MTDCGCRIICVYGLLEIRYCPLHAAAEKMRDLLRELLAIGNNNMTTREEAHEELSALHNRVSDFLADLERGRMNKPWDE